MRDKVRLTILNQLRDRQDLRLLRGEVPWSLAGTSGDRFQKSKIKRDFFIKRIALALDRIGVTAGLTVVDTSTGRIGLVIVDNGKEEVWQWNQ